MLSAIDKGRLQNFIFDNHSLWTHKILRKLLGVILKLKPAKRLLAHQQLKSRYLKALSKKHDDEIMDYSHPELNKK